MSTRSADTTRARLVEYVPWLARDYATNQGISTLLVLLLVSFIAVLPMFAAVGMKARQVPEEFAVRLMVQLAPTVVFIGALFATNGIVSNDRRVGYYRFVFAKPLSPVAFYAMTFATCVLGELVVTLALNGVFALAIRPMFRPELYAAVLVMFIAYAGIGFLLSAVLRLDWLSLVTVFLIAQLGWSVWGNQTGWRHWVLYVLPPVHRSESVYALITAKPGVEMPWASIAWLAGYGLGCFALGLLAVRKRPLGTG